MFLCFSSFLKIVFNELNLICPNFADLPESRKVDLRVYGSSNINCTQESLIISASINYILEGIDY